ncbi:MAG: arginyltransferase, partial [Pirellulales bacterium]|nr:arginyltransferase [Pirellulales bacterium]
MNHPESRLTTPQSQCRLIVVQDHLQPCPYLPDVTARMPLQLPVGTVTPEITDRLLAMGYRRSGDFVYRTQCPNCEACKPTRVLVKQFQLTRSLRRVLARGDRELVVRWGKPEVNPRRVELFNQHRQQRGLCGPNEQIDAESYRSFLVDTCCETKELVIVFEERIIGISIV